jgi:hypothetical protein
VSAWEKLFLVCSDKSQQTGSAILGKGFLNGQTATLCSVWQPAKWG